MKNSRLAFVFAGCAAVVAVILRFFQYASVIDFETGFFTEGSGIAGNIIYILFALAFVLGIVGAAADCRRKSTAFTKSADMLSSSSTLLVGAAYVIGGIFFAVSAYTALPQLGFQLISMATLALALLVIGFLLLSSKKIPPVAGYLQLVPTITLTCHAAVYFTSDLVIKRMSDQLVGMLADIVMVLLCLAFGRYLTGNEARLTRGKLIVYAVVEIVLSASITLGKLLFMLFGGDTASAAFAAGSELPAFSCGHFAMLIISVTILAALYSDSARDKEKAPADGERTSV